MPDSDCRYCGGIVRGGGMPVAIINLGPDATPADEANLRVQFAQAVAAERERIANGLRAMHERLSNEAKPKRKQCECGQHMDAHAGGWVLLHHDFFIVDRLAEAVRGEQP